MSFYVKNHFRAYQNTMFAIHLMIVKMVVDGHYTNNPYLLYTPK
jgi:hypothetical protein